MVLSYFFTSALGKGDVFFNPDAIMPGVGGRVTSRLGSVLDRSKFEQMKTEYYRLRGWDPDTGYLTAHRLRALGLDCILGDLTKQGLVAQ
jgi:hypothetical protein